MPNAKVLIRQSFKPLTKEKKLEVWNKVKARIATGEYCDFTKDEYFLIVLTNANRQTRKACNVLMKAFDELDELSKLHKA